VLATAITLVPLWAAAAGKAPLRDPVLRSSYALVVDQDTNEVLYEKNANTVSSIASITKLMTAMITLDAGLPLDEELVVSRDDRTTDGWGNSSLRPGVRLTRGEALHLALMSSENHAAQMLARTYPGGVEAAIGAMNAKAGSLGMTGAHFVDAAGLLGENRASPADLVLLVEAAFDYPEIREYSVSTEYRLPVGRQVLHYQSTNHLTRRPDWQIGLQKTGTSSSAGRCLVMQAVIEGRRVVMVLLDSFGKASRFADAQRLRDWLTARADHPSRLAPQ
jgi:D-alanyl-D-alanine endopeptidase (penicillin-binding protein 7)